MDREDASIAMANNVLFPLIAVLGLLTNGFVILVVLVSEKSRSNRSVANIFVINLAVADILFLLALPFYTPMIHIHGFAYSEAVCKLLEAIKHVSYHASILVLTAMSVDRYMAIVHSLRSMEYRTQRNARIICGTLWIVSIIVAIPIVVFSSLDVFHGNETTSHCRQMFPGAVSLWVDESELLNELGMYGDYDNLTDYYGHGGDSAGNSDYFPYFNHSTDDGSGEALKSVSSLKDEAVCVDRNHMSSMSFAAWQWFTFLAFFIVPVLIIVFCYSMIWHATFVRKFRSQRTEGMLEQQRGLQQTPPRQNWKQIQSKVTVMVAILVSAFILCWMPFQIWIIATLPPGVTVSFAKQCDVINAVVTLLAWSNSLLNPILYSVTSENFRKRALTTVSYMRYGYRSTIRMSVNRTSRTGLRTDMTVHSTPTMAPSPKGNNRRFDLSVPTSPKEVEAANMTSL